MIDDKTAELISSLLAYPDVKTDWKTPKVLSALPVIPLSFVHDQRLLNYFSMVTTVGTPQTFSAQELRIECMFPADQATETHHLNLMDAPDPNPPVPPNDSRRLADAGNNP